MSPTYLSLQALLTQSGRLRRLIKQAQVLQALEDRLSERLPPSLKRHCQVAAMHDDTLVLAASSAAWATRLRYLTPSLLDFLQQRCVLPTIRSIRIRITLPEGLPRIKPVSRPQLSMRNAECLHNAAQALTDPALRSALLRLASRARSSPLLHREGG